MSTLSTFVIVAILILLIMISIDLSNIAKHLDRIAYEMKKRNEK